jgi:hypothetical protein
LVDLCMFFFFFFWSVFHSFGLLFVLSFSFCYTEVIVHENLTDQKESPLLAELGQVLSTAKHY